MSNVKSGDLAIFSSHTINAGRLVRVIERAYQADRENGYDWRVETLSRVWVSNPQNGRTVGWRDPGAIVAARDRNLRRIDNPGEHERDEMLRPLPVEDLDIAHA